MAALETRTCRRCGDIAEQVRLGTLVSEPMGWVPVTVGGLPVTTVQLCPSCARDVRTLLATPPLVAEREREDALCAAFRRGYEDGCDDTERSHRPAETTAL